MTLDPRSSIAAVLAVVVLAVSAVACSSGAGTGTSGGGQASCAEESMACATSGDCCGALLCVSGVCSGASGGGSSGSTYGGPGSGSSSSGGATVTVSCENTWGSGGSLQDSFCDCTTSGSSGTPVYEGSSCQPSDITQVYDAICCASGNYPEGGDCSCYPTGAWHCESFGSYSCLCGYSQSASGSTPTNTCNDTPGADGNPWLCCANAFTCSCDESQTQCSQAGDVVVSDCSTPYAAGVTPPLTSCPAGTSDVSSCSTGPSPSSSSSGGGSGSGSSSGGGCDPSVCSGITCDPDGNCIACGCSGPGDTCVCQ